MLLSKKIKTPYAISPERPLSDRESLFYFFPLNILSTATAMAGVTRLIFRVKYYLLFVNRLQKYKIIGKYRHKVRNILHLYV